MGNYHCRKTGAGKSSPMKFPDAILMNRRRFLQTAGVGGLALAWPWPVAAAAPTAAAAGPGSFQKLTAGLLADWCEGLLQQQIREPANPARHGAFACPACARLHGRVGDSVYPLLHRARTTGESRFVDAAVKAAGWLKNVDSPDGAWRNDAVPDGWKGTTVFTAIAFAEALARHGDLLENSVRAGWRARLQPAAEFIHAHFTLHYSNINYGVTGAYALALLGRFFDDAKYRARGRELAHGALACISSPNGLLWGEGTPAEKLTPKKCRPVDLGYNVEESLPALALYALLENDREILEAVTATLAAHRQFMLPDGGWDNGWGTRSYKWTYWGSRTSDGCQAAYALLADRHPDFAAVAFRNTRLMRECTPDRLLCGGPHYAAHRIPPCVHHTFTHAKSLALLLDRIPDLDRLNFTAAAPPENPPAVKVFPEMDIRVGTNGPWRATISGYDWAYKPGIFQATGGSPALLHHRQCGPVCVASLANYLPVEEHNMQSLPVGKNFPLTPRVEMHQAGRWFTNLFDRAAILNHDRRRDTVELSAQCQLLDENENPPAGGPVKFAITYLLTAETLVIRAQVTSGSAEKWSLVLPVIAKATETARLVSARQCEISKPGGVLVLQSNLEPTLPASLTERVFNLVPGFEAFPVTITTGSGKIAECQIRFVRD